MIDAGQSAGELALAILALDDRQPHAAVEHVLDPLLVDEVWRAPPERIGARGDDVELIGLHQGAFASRWWGGLP